MAKRGKLRTMRIETGRNGYSVHAEHEPPVSKSDGGRGMAMPYEPEKPSFFNDRKSTVAHVDRLLAEHEGAEPTNDHDADDEAPVGRSALTRAMRGEKRSMKE
jgi:hypothetical protein